jgi:transposase
MPKKHRRNKQGHVVTSNIPKLDALEQINLNAAGLDIGDDEIYVAVPEGRAPVSVKVFKTFTADLEALADWLGTCDIETVAMEATGVYWIPLYDLLEERGFEVYLVNARHLKKVTGRKTDVLDCQWLQQLHTYGLLKASFRPPEDIGALRALVRHRANLVQSAARETQHMQKALQQMNVKLTNVISDITGVTGMAILRDIVAGERDPHVLARHRHAMCTKSEEEIAQALQGHYRAEHVFALQQALEAHDFYQRQLRVCDVEIEKRCASLESQVDLAEKPLPPARRPLRKPKGNAPDFDLRTYLYQMAGVDLTRIDGLDALSVLKILSETGVDMTPWPTAKHFTAWLGVCPHEDKTGGKVKKTRTRKTQNRAAAALRMVAQTLAHSHSALGAYYRRMRTRLGAPEAVTATAHKLARIIYAMLKNRTEYHDLGEEAYEEQVRERALHSLKRKAAKLGFDLVDSRPRPALA